MLIPDKTKTTYSNSNVLGINLDSERLLLVYGSITGLISERLVVPTPQTAGFANIIELIMVQADRLLNLTKAQHLPLPDRISAAVSGNLDAETGIISSSTDFPDWKKEPLRSMLSSRFNLPVHIEKKADAGALAEYYMGSAKDVRSLIFLSMTPTLRIGILNNGILFRNPGGCSGQLGNFEITLPSPDGNPKPRLLNRVASSKGLVELALERHPNHWEKDMDLMKIIQDARSGDPYAQEVFQEAGFALGKSLINLSHLLRPEVIIAGYPGCLLDEHLLAPAREVLSRELLSEGCAVPKLIPSQLCARLPELQAIAPVIHATRNQS